MTISSVSWQQQGWSLSGLAAVPASAATDPTISINNPAAAGQPKAGTVVLSGNLSTGRGTTTVLYVVDATASTQDFAGKDCNGDGTVGPRTT